LGAVIGLGVFWVAELKRDPRAPFESVAEVILVSRKPNMRVPEGSYRVRKAFGFGENVLMVHI
jgi:hypothetical protein